jgi:hypothetical protein
MISALETSLVIQITLQLPVLLLLFAGLVLSIIASRKNPKKSSLLSIAFMVMIVRVFSEVSFTVLYGVNHMNSPIENNQLIETALFLFNKVTLVVGWSLLLIPLFSTKLNPVKRPESVRYGN